MSKRKQIKELQRKLNMANATVYALMNESATLERHIGICERENERKEIIIGYLEDKLIGVINE